MKYEVILPDKIERFLDWYLKEHPLRPEHTRNDYPGLVITNFINSMMKRKMSEGQYCPKCTHRNEDK